MRIAILLVGHVRTWDITKESFKKTFEPLNADIFLSTYDLRYGHHPHIQGRIGDFGDDLLTQDEITSMFSDVNLKGFTYEKSISVDELIEAEMVKVTPKMRHRSSLAQYRKLHQAIDLMNQFETKIEQPYDYVLKTRCDMVYKEKIPLDTDPNTVTVDSGNIFPNDCFLFSSRNSMVNISNFIMNEFYNPRYSDSGENPPHQMLLNAIKESGLTITTVGVMNHVIRRGGKKEYY